MTPFESELGFDLRFHFFYAITIPLNELAGAGDELTMFLHVVPGTNGAAQADLVRRLTVPSIAQNASGSIHLDGRFDAGAGAYNVSLMVRDHKGQVCSARWKANGVLDYRDRNITLAISPGQVEAPDDRLFHAEPRVPRGNPGESLRIKIVINFAPQLDRLSALASDDVIGLISILRNIARDPRIAKFSLVAFNLNEQRIFFRSEEEDQISFPALGEAVASLKPGVIEYRKLIDPHSEAEFLSHLIEAEVTNSDADAVVLVSPKVNLREKVALIDSGATMVNRLFYMDYNLNAHERPWHDAMGRIVKHLRGIEYGISCPHDIWSSWTDAMGHIAPLKFRDSRTSTSN